MAEEVEVYEEHQPAPMTLFGTNDPEQVMEQATKVAQALAKAVRDQGLAVMIGGSRGREHVKVEGWTLLGSLLGVFPVTVWSRPLEDEQGHQLGWEARVEAVTRDGAVVGAAEAECRNDESNWKNRDSYALRSMAQTRAASKALRMPLGFVMQLAGFEATPAEEMPREQEPPASGGSKLTPETLEELRAMRENLADMPEWSARAVLESASRSFGRSITKPEELYEEEARQIIGAMQKWQDDKRRQALLGQEPTPAAEDFQRIDPANDIPWPGEAPERSDT